MRSCSTQVVRATRACDPAIVKENGTWAYLWDDRGDFEFFPVKRGRNARVEHVAKVGSAAGGAVP